MKTKFLGNNKTTTNFPGSSKILDPIVRQNQSSDISGVDYWNAYEFSYLNASSQQKLETLEIKIPADSKITVESKSVYKKI